MKGPSDVILTDGIMSLDAVVARLEKVGLRWGEMAVLVVASTLV